MPKHSSIYAAVASLLLSAGASAGPSVTVQFDSAQYRLGSGEKQILEQFWSKLPADQLKQLQFQIEGYADPMGSNEDNRKLATHRALAVRDWLSRHGVANAAISFRSGIAPDSDSRSCPTTLARVKRVACLAPARRATLSVTLPPQPEPQSTANATPEPAKESPPQLVQSESTGPAKIPGRLYLALNIHQAAGSQTAGDFRRTMQRDGVDVAISDYDVRRPAWQLALGYRYHPRMAVELGYLDLGNVSFDFNAEAVDATSLTRTLDSNLPFTGSGWTLANRFELPLGRWRASASAGLYFWSDDPDTGDQAITPGSRNGTDPLIGLQAAWPLTDRVELGLQYHRLFLDKQDVDLWGGGVIWRF
ncbi:OmpA family protein [Microbulbifer sp. SAOS-129_SWC]|uniref:OmpA family protein n=1 Tax=Microbulbifer sp. SAOS-129_SWC TaxID=3145235 RepID=UPI003216DC9A